MKKWRSGIVVLLAVMLACVMAACTPVKVAGDLSINSDGTGTRSIVGTIRKDDWDAEDGSAYYYLKLHGDDLQKWMADTYKTLVPGSEEWLKITVVDGGAVETVTLTFDFTSFDEYKTRLRALAYDANQMGGYTDPIVIKEKNQVAAYVESVSVMTAIMKSIHGTILADDTVYDDLCTINGKSGNNGGSGGVAATNGIEIMTGAPALEISIDGSKVAGVYKETDILSYVLPRTVTVVEEVVQVIEPTPVPATPTPVPTTAPTPTEAPAQTSGVSIALIAIVAVVAVIEIIAAVALAKKAKK